MSVRWGNTSMNALNKNNPKDKRIIDIIMSDDRMERQPDIHIHIVVPNEFMNVGKFNIGITAGIETTGCVHEWIQGCNRMDLIIVPSEFTKKVFLDTVFQSQNDKTGQKGPDLKIEKPIEVLFEGVDLNIYKKTNEFNEDLVKEFEQIPERFNFLYTGHWLQGNLGEDRKDTGMLIKVFLETFKNVKNPPGLIMKTSGATFSVIDREEILSKINDIKSTVKGRLPNIYVLHGDLSDDEMNQLYNYPKVKAHISLTHGEGFGRPLLEATLSEKPVIAPNWSGHVDFLDRSYSTLLPGSLSNVPKGAFHEKMFLDGSQWFTVNYPNSGKVMMDIFKNQPKYLINAKKQSIVSKTFSLDNMTKKFDEIVNSVHLDAWREYYEEQPQEVKLQLPKLKKVDTTKTTKKLDIKLPGLKKV
jgi:hypothetical protein